MTDRMTRRPKGDGSISKRKDGRYDVSLTHKGNEQKTTAADQKSALAKMEEFRKLAGLSTVEGAFRDYCDQWLAAKKRSLAPDSYRRYEVELRLRIKPLLGDLDLQEIDADDIEGYVTELVEACECKAGVYRCRCRNCGHPISSVQQVNFSLLILRTIFNKALLSRKIIWNPAKAVPYLKQDEDEVFKPSPLSVEEVKRFFEHHARDRLIALYTLTVALGLRSAEARGLRWRDIDLDGGTVTIWWQLTRSRGQWEWVKLKTKESRRTNVRLPAQCLSVLKAHRERQSLEKSWAGTLYEDRDLVFCHEDGTPVWSSSLSKRFKKMCLEAGVEPRRIHDLRHTTGHLLASMKVDQRVIMEALRHTKIEMSIHYSDVPDENVAAAYNLVERQIYG